MAWLALYIPALPLQAFSRTLIESAPVVVFEADTGGRRSLIVARNRAAARLGIRTGATLAEANALSNGTHALVSLHREALREHALLQHLAGIVSTLTPNIHISDGYGLLMEISGSLALFGGEAAIIARVQQLMAAETLRCHVVIAPTARGARWLGRAHRELVVNDAIAEWLNELALDCTDLDSTVIAELNTLNLHTLAAVRRLPLPALNQRFGATSHRMLGEAYGDVSAPLSFWAPPRRFDTDVEFADLARETSHWLPGVEELLRRLERFLTLNASATPVIELSFYEGRLHCTQLSVHAAHAMHIAGEWLRLVTVKLERQPVPHEVSRIELCCNQIEPMQFDSVDFFDRSKQHDHDWAALGALLRLRLGQNGIRRPLVNRTILPESVQFPQLLDSSDRTLAQGATATAQHAHGKDDANSSAPPSATDLQDARPTWFVHPARRLSDREVSSLSPTITLRQPERLQEDWSQPDGAPAIERDYYVASTPDDRLLWVYRERPSNDWFLQGVFG